MPWVIATLVIVLVGVGTAVLLTRPHAVPPAGSITPTSGAVVFSDGFADPASGWPTQTLASGTTFAYQGGAYVITAAQTLDHFAYAPYTAGVAQASFSVTAMQDKGGPQGSGYGVVCRTGTGSSRVSYEFRLQADGVWAIERRDGLPSATTPAALIKKGTSSAAAGPQAVTVMGMCLSPGSGRVTTLVFYVNGNRVADFTDDDSNLSGSVTWTGGILVVSRDTATNTVVVTNFTERNLG